MSRAVDMDVGRVLARAGTPAFAYRSFQAAPDTRAGSLTEAALAPADLSRAPPLTPPAPEPKADAVAPPAMSAAGQFSLLGAALAEAASVNLDEPQAREARPLAPTLPPTPPPALPRPATAAAPAPLSASPLPGPLPTPFPPRAAPALPPAGAPGEDRRYALADMFRILAGHSPGAVPGRSEPASRMIARFGSR